MTCLLVLLPVLQSEIAKLIIDTSDTDCCQLSVLQSKHFHMILEDIGPKQSSILHTIIIV